MNDAWIINAARNVPTWIRIRDFILTLLLWLLYLYLIRDVFFFLGEAFFGYPYFKSLSFPATLRTLTGYLFIIAINSTVFIGWALYSKIRFRNNERRHFSYLVNTADLGQLYGIPAEKIVTWQEARLLTMRHDNDGKLLEIIL